MNDPKLIRTSAGEEILCMLEAKDTDHWIIKKPLVMIPAGQQQLGFMPWLPYCDLEEGLTVHKSFISFVAKPASQLISEYHTSTTGLLVPEKPELKLSTT